MHWVAPRLVSILMVSAVLGLQSRAGAEGLESKPNQSASGSIAEHLRRGRLARDAGRWPEARAAYKAALDAAESARSSSALRAEIAGELGLCELSLLRYRDAAEHLALSLEGRQDLRPPFRQEVDAALAMALPHVATLYLSVVPPDAEVLLDGKVVGRSPGLVRLYLEPGRHIVRASSPGHEEAFQSFEGVAGTDQRITMTLPRSAVSAKSAAPTEKKMETAMAPPPKEQASASTMSRVASRLALPGLVLTGLTAMAGGTFLIGSQVTDGELDEYSGRVPRDACATDMSSSSCLRLRELQDRRNLLFNAGWGTLAASGVLGAATVALILVGSGKPHDGIRVVPIATGQHAGLTCYGAW